MKITPLNAFYVREYMPTDESTVTLWQTRGGGKDGHFRRLLKAGWLEPRGLCPIIGAETGRAVRDGIAVYRSQHGSVRYIAAVGGEPVAVLQVVQLAPNKAQIANVYTSPAHRRRGHAERLLARARRDFAVVAHSENMTKDGGDLGTPKSKLVAWYRGLGFVPNKGRAKSFYTRDTMIRAPRPERSAPRLCGGRVVL